MEFTVNNHHFRLTNRPKTLIIKDSQLVCYGQKHRRLGGGLHCNQSPVVNLCIRGGYVVNIDFDELRKAAYEVIDEEHLHEDIESTYQRLITEGLSEADATISTSTLTAVNMATKIAAAMMNVYHTQLMEYIQQQNK